MQEYVFIDTIYSKSVFLHTHTYTQVHAGMRTHARTHARTHTHHFATLQCHQTKVWDLSEFGSSSLNQIYKLVYARVLR